MKFQIIGKDVGLCNLRVESKEIDNKAILIGRHNLVINMASPAIPRSCTYYKLHVLIYIHQLQHSQIKFIYNDDKSHPPKEISIFNQSRSSHERAGLFSAKYSWLSAFSIASEGLLLASEAAADWP